MAPKRKSIDSADAAPPPTVTDEVNKEYLTNLAAALKRVQDAKEFKGIIQKDPLGIGGKSKGFQAAFSATDCQIALKSAGVYQCAGNIWWINMTSAPVQGVPYNYANVMKLKNHHFGEGPTRMPFPLVVAVDSETYRVHTNKGGLVCCSPEEILHAYVFAVDDAICNKSANLKEWADVGLAATMTFEILPSSEDRYFRAINLREDLVADYRTMARTPFQWTYIVWNFKIELEKSSGMNMSAAKVSDAYQAKARLAPDSEKLSKDFIDRALTVYRSLLMVPEVRDALAWCEENYGVDGPFNNMAALHVLTMRAQNNKQKIWIVQHIIDMIRAGLVGKTELSARVLTGGKDSGKQGYADVIIYKRLVLQHLLGEFMRARAFHVDFCSKARDNLENHNNFRKYIAGHPGSEVADRSWMASANKSGEQLKKYHPGGQLSIRSLSKDGVPNTDKSSNDV